VSGSGGGSSIRRQETEHYLVQCMWNNMCSHHKISPYNITNLFIGRIGLMIPLTCHGGLVVPGSMVPKIHHCGISSLIGVINRDEIW
jgi:hypothetical protein